MRLQRLLDERDAIMGAAAAKAANGEMTSGDAPQSLSKEVMTAVVCHSDLLARYRQQIDRWGEVNRLNNSKALEKSRRDAERIYTNVQESLEMSRTKRQKETLQAEQPKERKTGTSPVRQSLSTPLSVQAMLRPEKTTEKAAPKKAAPTPPPDGQKKPDEDLRLDQMFGASCVAQNDTANLGAGRSGPANQGGRGEKSSRGIPTGRGIPASRGAGRGGPVNQGGRGVPAGQGAGRGGPVNQGGRGSPASRGAHGGIGSSGSPSDNANGHGKFPPTAKFPRKWSRWANFGDRAYIMWEGVRYEVEDPRWYGGDKYHNLGLCRKAWSLKRGEKCEKTWQTCPLRHWWFEGTEDWVDEGFIAKHGKKSMPATWPDHPHERYEGVARLRADNTTFSSSREQIAGMKESQPGAIEKLGDWNKVAVKEREEQASAKTPPARVIWADDAEDEDVPIDSEEARKRARAQGQGGARGGHGSKRV